MDQFFRAVDLQACHLLQEKSGDKLFAGVSKLEGEDNGLRRHTNNPFQFPDTPPKQR